MKKSIFTILLALTMLFGSYGQVPEEIDNINNATTVEVKFENPQLEVLVNDQRDEDYINTFTQVLNESLLTNDLLDESLAKTNDHLAEHLRLYKRKESESAIDYLMQKTKMSEQEINNALKQYHKITLFTQLVILFMIIGIYISYILEHNKYERDWRHSIFKVIGITILLYFAYGALHSWLLHIYARNYVELEHLIQLIQ